MPAPHCCNGSCRYIRSLATGQKFWLLQWDWQVPFGWVRQIDQSPCSADYTDEQNIFCQRLTKVGWFCKTELYPKICTCWCNNVIIGWPRIMHEKCANKRLKELGIYYKYKLPYIYGFYHDSVMNIWWKRRRMHISNFCLNFLDARCIEIKNLTLKTWIRN